MYYFVSDIHLGAGNAEQRHRTEDAFCRWLDMAGEDAHAIYLMGDIFDFWFEYKRVVPQGFVRVLGRLAELTRRGVEVNMFIGNHDMWCGDYLARECGVKMHFKPEVCDIGGLRLHLAHGDNMNIKGQPMLRLMNAFFRSTSARWLFRWFVHPDLAMKFGTWWSGKSRKSHSKDNITIDDLGFLVEYAQQHHATHNNIDAYIFGHMHLAHNHYDGTLRVLFMSDWSGDEAHYITLDDERNLNIETFRIE